MDDDARRRALSEVNVLRVIRHPFVIGYHRSFICDSTLHIVLDYAAGGDLLTSRRLRGAESQSAPQNALKHPDHSGIDKMTVKHNLEETQDGETFELTLQDKPILSGQTP